MIYKQIGTITNKLTKITSDQSPFQLLSITPPSIIKDSEDKEQYKKYKATQFVSGEFSEEANQPIIRNNENLYYRDLIIIDIENTGYNSQQAIKLIDSKLQLYKYLLYATINHTEENPRFRLILPPSKKMNEKEYKLYTRFFFTLFSNSRIPFKIFIFFIQIKKNIIHKMVTCHIEIIYIILYYFIYILR